jgi:branched-subunit amino acid ABC-type transport system permease component
MELISDLASPIIIGILLGGLYVVVALGLSLVFGVMKVINVAHGTLVILGSYLAFAVV